MARVALISCPDYQEETVRQAVERGFACFGGVNQLFPAGERVLLKPNLLSGVEPDRAVTTHPSVFRGVIDALQKQRIHLGYGDSPGFGNPDQVAEKAGLAEVARKSGVELADFVTQRVVDFPQGQQHKRFHLAEGLFQYDSLVSLPKWKTHGLTRITGAVKNQFGCIPGLMKTEFHFKLLDVEPLARFLVDLNRFIAPRFFIMDAVMGMEGEGPKSGDPRKLGVIGFSDDPVALDATLCRMIRVKPELVATCLWGESMGLGVMDEALIELMGDPVDQFVCPDYRVERGKMTVQKNRKYLGGFRRFLLSRPRIDRKLCRLCEICVTVCPAHPKALVMKSRHDPPVLQERSCIRCFCCQEMCPHRSISIYTPLFRRMIPLR